MIEQFIFKRLAWYNEPKNLRIGGLVNVGINTPYKLAVNLKCDVADISSFKIVGNVIHCRMKRFKPNTATTGFSELVRQNLTFWIEDSKFYNELSNGVFMNCTALKELQMKHTMWMGGYPKISNTQLERLDLPTLVTTYSNQSAISNNKLKYITVPNLVEIKGNGEDFAYNPNLEVFDAKNLRKINQEYQGQVRDVHFNGTGKIGNCVYKVHIDLKTSAPDGGLNLNLRKVWRDRQARIEFYNDSGNFVSSV